MSESPGSHPPKKLELIERTKDAIENLESNLRVTEGTKDAANEAITTLRVLCAAQSDITPYEEVAAMCDTQSQSLRSLIKSAHDILEALQ